ncbi:MAG: VWA domain-containing protein [Acidobacteriota bacterium]
MSVTFADPRWLWLLAAVPLVWAALWLTRSTFSQRQRWLQAVVRSTLLAVLAAALAQPVVSLSRPRIAVVYVVDVSHSIASRAIARAADRIDALNAALKPDRARILTFGSDTAAVVDTNALRSLANGQARTSVAGAAQTDIQRALTDARADVRPGESPRLVLFSDGRETRGDAQTAAIALAAQGIPVFVEPLDVKDLGDAWIDALHWPATWPAAAPVRASVDVWSQRAVDGATIELRDGDRLVGSARAALQPGVTTIEVSATIPAPGSHVLSASLSAPDDPLPVNNQLAREVVVQPATRVLYVDGSPEGGGSLQRALTQAGLIVTTRAPSALPAGSAGLSAWDAIIVSDVARATISQTAMRSLTTFVEEDGGGLLFAGGDKVFGEGHDDAPTGYHGTEIERLLPVTIERKDEPDIALVMVLDKSWSMAGPVMELCKSAAQAAVEALDDRQAVGVLSFDDRFQWDVTPRPVGPNREAIRHSIAAIQPGGDTLIFPALEQAYLQLRKFRANAKHVVLLSDGRSYPDDYETLVKRMVAAGMTVSSIAVGREADSQLLSRIATWGKGRAYAVLNAAEVPKIFVKEAKTAMPAFDEGEGVVPVVKTRSVLATVALRGMPPLRGRTAMVLKDTATEILATPKGEPVLAWWPIGRGRTAAFASDVKDRWGRDWVGWSGYGPLFATLVRSIARQAPRPLTLDVRHTEVDSGRQLIHIGVEAREADGRYQNLSKPQIRLRSDGGQQAVVASHQVAPGRYEATVTANAGDSLLVEASQTGLPAAAARRIVPDPDAEYRLRPPDDVRLEALAQATGGAYRPALDQVKRTTGRAQPERRALWPWLVLVAAIIWPVDVLLRRVRLFDAVTELT